MANPFEVQPVNVLQALMLGTQGYNQGRKAVQDAALSEAGQLYAAGDIRGAQAAAARGGSLQALMGFAGLQNSDRDFRFRESEAGRAQTNADRGFGLQERQLGQSAAQNAAQLALQRQQLGLSQQQFDYTRQQGDRPEKLDVNGVPMLLDRKNNTLVPINGIPAQPGNIPPGVDPTTYRKELAQAAVKDQTTTRDLQEGGKGVLAMVDQLESKISSAVDPSVAKKFGSATGPFVGPASEAGGYDPRKLLYEGLQSRDSKAYLDRIKQDAQAISSVMERNLLKGGGSITNEERASIRLILGKISEARSPEDALALLNNFRGIVRQMFKMEGGAPAPAAAGGAAPGGLPPLPPGFVIQ